MQLAGLRTIQNVLQVCVFFRFQSVMIKVIDSRRPWFVSLRKLACYSVSDSFVAKSGAGDGGVAQETDERIDLVSEAL